MLGEQLFYSFQRKQAYGRHMGPKMPFLASPVTCLGFGLWFLSLHLHMEAATELSVFVLSLPQQELLI